MIIRAARSDEVRTLAALGAIAWEQAFKASGENTGDLMKNAEATYFHFCTHYWPVIVVAEVDREILGWGAVQDSDNKITDLWVLPNFQRKGIGSALLRVLEEQIKSRNCKSVKLDTHAKNTPALAFFKAQGYYVSSFQSSYSQELDRNVDSLVLKKRFGKR